MRVHAPLLFEDLVQNSPDPSFVPDETPPPTSRPSTARKQRRNQKKLDLYKAQTVKMLADQEVRSLLAVQCNATSSYLPTSSTENQQRAV